MIITISMSMILNYDHLDHHYHLIYHAYDHYDYGHHYNQDRFQNEKFGYQFALWSLA